LTCELRVLFHDLRWKRDLGRHPQDNGASAGSVERFHHRDNRFLVRPLILPPEVLGGTSNKLGAGQVVELLLGVKNNPDKVSAVSGAKSRRLLRECPSPWHAPMSTGWAYVFKVERAVRDDHDDFMLSSGYSSRLGSTHGLGGCRAAGHDEKGECGDHHKAR